MQTTLLKRETTQSGSIWAKPAMRLSESMDSPSE